MLNKKLEKEWVDCPLSEIYKRVKEHQPISIRVWIPTRRGQGDWKSVAYVYSAGRERFSAKYHQDLYTTCKPKPVDASHRFQIIHNDSIWRSYG